MRKLTAKRISISVSVILLLLTAAFIIFEYLNGNGTLMNVSKEQSVLQETGIMEKFDMDSKADFHVSDSGGYFLSTKDGIIFLDSQGIESMSGTYNFQNPVLVGEGDFAAIFEPGSNTFYVYSTLGAAYQKTMEYPILTVSLNTLGYSSVILQKGDEYEIYTFNASGTAMTKVINVTYNVSPVASDISNDGNVLAVSYLDINNTSIVSSINFIYTNQAEYYEYKDGIFASSANNSGEYIFFLKFMKDNSLLAVSDKNIRLFELPAYREKWILPLKNNLDNFTTGKNYFAVAFGKPFLNTDSEPEKLVRTYDLELNVLSEFQSEYKVTMLTANVNAIIAGSGRKVSAVSNKGDILWEYNAPFDYEKVEFMGNINTAVISTPNKTEIFRLTKVK